MHNWTVVGRIIELITAQITRPPGIPRCKREDSSEKKLGSFKNKEKRGEQNKVASF